VSELWSAPWLFCAGYIAMDTAKYVVGLILMTMGKKKAFEWWDREVIP